MSENRIIYRLGDNRVALMTPILNSNLSVEQIAQKDVPNGCEWRVVSVASLPSFDKIDLWRWTNSGPLSVVE